MADRWLHAADCSDVSVILHTYIHCSHHQIMPLSIRFLYEFLSTFFHKSRSWAFRFHVTGFQKASISSLHIFGGLPLGWPPFSGSQSVTWAVHLLSAMCTIWPAKVHLLVLITFDDIANLDLASDPLICHMVLPVHTNNCSLQWSLSSSQTSL